jgi:glycosyltransferase involved in cell wall biosynthesis
MRRPLFVLVPSLTPDGPVKGAIALANALAGDHDVTLASLRRGPGAEAPVSPRVRQRCVGDHVRGLGSAVGLYRRWLAEAGGRHYVASLSMCFSADLVNGFCKSQALTCSSVRGNLFANYRMDYGLRGTALAALHLTMLRRFDHVVAMTPEMAAQVQRFAERAPSVIGNFIDEAPLESRRAAVRPAGPPRLVFVGTLSSRKQPELLVKALSARLARGGQATLDLIGDGPLMPAVKALVERLRIGHAVNLHGFLADPAPVVAAADVFVLPSMSEGVSRAALESLHLGLPCVMRDADGNGALVRSGINGELFTSDADLPAAIDRAIGLAAGLAWPRASLLPATMRQKDCARAYAQLLLSHDLA